MWSSIYLYYFISNISANMLELLFKIYLFIKNKMEKTITIIYGSIWWTAEKITLSEWSTIQDLINKKGLTSEQTLKLNGQSTTPSTKLADWNIVTIITEKIKWWKISLSDYKQMVERNSTPRPVKLTIIKNNNIEILVNPNSNINDLKSVLLEAQWIDNVDYIVNNQDEVLESTDILDEEEYIVVLK